MLLITLKCSRVCFMKKQKKKNRAGSIKQSQYFLYLDSDLALYLESAETLKINDPKATKFHMLPKIHKINNPGRPVVSSIGCHNTNITKFVEYHLQPIVKNIPSYVQE